MFLVIKRRRTELIFSSISPLFIVHFHVLVLARISGRDTSPSLPSAPSSVDSLGAPIAFPIFRPPMVSVHRQKSAVEQETPPRHLPSPSLPNQSAVEQISVPFDGVSSSSVVEEDDNLALQQQQQEEEEEELAFSPVQFFNANKLINANNHSTPAASFHRLEAFDAHRRKGNEKGTDQTTTTSTNLFSTHPTNGGKSHLNSKSAALSTPTTLINVLHNINDARTSSTPQFPVFTGMGMEIIESKESDGERSSTSAAETAENIAAEEDHWHSLQRKMHYNWTNNSKANSSSNSNHNLLNFVVHSNKVTGQSTHSSSTTGTILNEENASTTRGSSTFKSPILIDPLTQSTIGTNLLGHSLQMNAVENSTKSIPPATDEVTEDLLAIFSSTSGLFGQTEHLSRKASSKGNGIVGEHDNTFGHQIGQSLNTKLTTIGINEEIIPRPTTEKTRGDAHLATQMAHSSSTQKATEMPSKSPSSTTTATTTMRIMATTVKENEPTQLVATKTATMAAVEPPKSSSTMPKTTAPTEHFSDGGHIRTEMADVRIPTSTSTSNSNDLLRENHIDEEIRELTTTTPKRRMSTPSSWSSIRNKIGGQNEAQLQQQKENALEASRSTERSSDGSANFRLFIIAGIIAVLFVGVGIGSICTGRYVRKSRQLHGKYRPAAYELQTTRPAPLSGSSTAFAPCKRTTDCNDQQHLEFGHVHQIAPTHHYSQQLTLNANGGREERLI